MAAYCNTNEELSFISYAIGTRFALRQAKKDPRILLNLA
jgi:hypothetical protein